MLLQIVVIALSKLTSGEISGHNRSRSECFQLQPVVCRHLLVFSL